MNGFSTSTFRIKEEVKGLEEKTKKASHGVLLSEKKSFLYLELPILISYLTQRPPLVPFPISQPLPLYLHLIQGSTMDLGLLTRILAQAQCAPRAQSHHQQVLRL